MSHPIAEANPKSPFGSLSADEFYDRHAVSHSSSYFTNSRGFKLFTQSWTPQASTKSLALVAIIHGFTGESSWLTQLTAVYFAKSGFITCAIDLQGHGYSDGLDGLVAHIPDINPVVDDCMAYFNSFRSKHAAAGLPCFIYGESMGAAIAILMHLKGSTPRWDGLILSGAMLGVSPNATPSWIVGKLFIGLAYLAPKWQVVSTGGELCDSAIKEVWKRELICNSPRHIRGRLRIGTAIEMVRVCNELQRRFEEVDVGALLIVHGGSDIDCDPNPAQELYDRAGSKDKTVKIYEGMRHLLVGGTQEDVDLVFGDILVWLKDRAGRLQLEKLSSITAPVPVSEE